MNWQQLLDGDRLRKSGRIQDSRNEFESDFGRIIFSPALRRMHDKTQVFPLTADDNIHSRLTHSMEVMAIGYSLGRRIADDPRFLAQPGIADSSLSGAIPILLQNACLIHDIGNPPFGHFGESVFQTFFTRFFEKKSELGLSELEKKDFTLFDGNAQGLRVVTKLQILNDEYGLNLTYATLGAFLKYPNSADNVKSKLHQKKHGVFQSEVEYLSRIADACGLVVDGEIVRHPLCFLMEAADSICYLVMDIEDGFSKDWYSFEQLAAKLSGISEVATEAKEIVGRYTGPGERITRMVKFRIFLIQYLVNLAVENFLENLPAIYAGKYDKELIFDDPNKLAELLSEFCAEEIFPKREITSLELTGNSVLSGLLSIYTDLVFHEEKACRKRAQRLLSDSILRIAFLESKLPPKASIDELSNYYKLRVIVDFISGMTDQFALDHYQKLSGQKIS